MRVVYFVEGSVTSGTSRIPDPFEHLWLELIPELLQTPPPQRVCPINKKHLVAMDPDLPPMSSFAARLDDLIVREIQRSEFDIAVILWDLVPVWHPPGRGCRWDETRRLYQALAESAALPEEWRRNAQRHRDELEARVAPGVRTRLQPWRPHEIFAVCMEPMFEALLTLSEGIVRQVLGIPRRRIQNWPRWNPQSPRPDTDLLQRAILAAQGVRPEPTVFRRMRGDMRTMKHSWAVEFLRHMADDPECRDLLVRHPMLTRLAEFPQRPGDG